MNGLEKSIHELINMLVQYEATTHKSAPAVLAREASTSKVKGKKVERWKRKKEKGKSNLIMTAQNKRELDNHENAQLCHASHAWTHGTWIHVGNAVMLEHNSDEGETIKANARPLKICHPMCLLNCNPIDTEDAEYVCGPLNTPARGGFSYFITFIDDHSRYDYVYLMRYKFEGYGRFKEYRLEVENPIGHTIKALWSNRGGEYLNGEFIDYLKENVILSKWTPPGTPQLNSVAKMRNRTLLDIVRSMMSFTELSLSICGYALETAAKLLNMAPSKIVPRRHTRYGMVSLRPTST
ncbi:hypothetical protein Sango_1888700 [Sesamum angolense]|uniref:Integrase catalytic domain-containing protein n=1 Tax=Sesamum angolense TaxID=2727404 RepID=A0AAE1WIX5_9LAMI|nr:hypothetical protein Sango_1888700 [Sesamum angolense]